MTRWAKIHDRIAESNGFSEAANEDRLAGLLFLLALPQCDVYGIIPASYRIFTAKVCPLMDVSQECLTAAFECLERHGLVVYYDGSDGRPYLYLPNYLKYQDVTWVRVGPPEHPLPPGWTLPIGMKEAYAVLRKDGKPEASGKLREWISERSKLESQGVVSDHSKSGPSRQRREVGRRQTEPKATSVSGDVSAPACASGLTSPTENDKTDDGHDRAVADLCLALGIDTLPEGWEYLCTDWVSRFGNKPEGRSFLYGLIRVEADRIRANGKRKGGPKLSEYLSRAVNNRVTEKKKYYA